MERAHVKRLAQCQEVYVNVHTVDQSEADPMHHEEEGRGGLVCLRANGFVEEDLADQIGTCTYQTHGHSV